MPFRRLKLGWEASKQKQKDTIGTNHAFIDRVEYPKSKNPKPLRK